MHCLFLLSDNSHLIKFILPPLLLFNLGKVLLLLSWHFEEFDSFHQCLIFRTSIELPQGLKDGDILFLFIFNLGGFPGCDLLLLFCSMNREGVSVVVEIQIISMDPHFLLFFANFLYLQLVLNIL